ncbi:hypothetical protein PHSY_002746 [Pseudozyma hubeiensis SY62]|uniref:Uncharacterized protein n=1 Tax=Pseudozyma hubeiensis (strain SY62) TaxID=1305764 RepID=R9P1P6_PSEHS|nr:hypothetical protein PHSY_002746 [Pseudozyma hubeiensis SY62]GAC95171.1 hypothetical protein PHSY_002746 [Pseudozyma hubeiensis SY62]
MSCAFLTLTWGKTCPDIHWRSHIDYRKTRKQQKDQAFELDRSFALSLMSLPIAISRSWLHRSMAHVLTKANSRIRKTDRNSVQPQKLSSLHMSNSENGARWLEKHASSRWIVARKGAPPFVLQPI